MSRGKLNCSNTFSTKNILLKKDILIRWGFHQFVSIALTGLTRHLLLTGQPSLKFGGVLPAKLIEIQGGFAGKVGL